MKCKLCSMEATYRMMDDRGIFQFYCDHHAPKGADRLGRPSWWKVYKPLFFVFLVISILTFVTAIFLGDLGADLIQNIHRWFMGYFFLVFGLSKAFTWKSFAASFRNYDPAAKVFPVYGHVYPLVEIILAFMFLFGFEILLASLVTIIILSITTVGVLRSIKNKDQLQCACIGTWITLPLGWATVFENILMIGMSLSIINMIL